MSVHTWLLEEISTVHTAPWWEGSWRHMGEEEEGQRESDSCSRGERQNGV